MRTYYKKSNNWLLFLGVTMMIMGSCKRDLNLSPTDQFASTTFWTSEQNALQALTGVYRGNIQMIDGAEFAPTDWWSYHGLVFLDLATDNGYDRRGDNSPLTKLTNGTLTSSDPYLDNYWSTSYARIARCNYFIENIGKTPMDTSIINRMSAEARFIRACEYFYLSQFFGDVPLVTKTLSLQQANTVTKSSKADVEKFVENELIACANELPWQSQLVSSEKGRATKQAALAFLGRLYLAEQQWNDAAHVYDEIINKGDNIIDPNYPSLFNGTNENSNEMIFQTQYSANTAPDAILQHIFPRGLGGWHFFCPLGSLVEDYNFKDGTPFSFNSPKYNPKDFGADRDPRLSFNILWNEETYAGYTYVTNPDSTNSQDQLTLTIQATRTGFCIRKYFPPGGFSGDLQNSGIDIPIIRYAEVLLSDLEAKIEAGIPITQSLLDATINQVRGRADVMMPPITEKDPAKLLQIVRHERRVELPFEGLRLWDLMRWHTADSVLEGDFYGAAYPGAKNIRKAPDGHTDPYGRWYVTTKHFREQDYQWPIPQREVNINPNL